MNKDRLPDSIGMSDDFGLDRKRMEAVAAEYLGFAVEFVADVTHDPEVGVQTSHVSEIPRP